MRRYPGDAELLATATQVYLKYGCYTNALSIIEQELVISATNVNALVNKGFACIQVGAFEQAIPALTRVLAVDTNNHSALLNRAIACLRANRLENRRATTSSCKRLSRLLPRSAYGLGEIAWRRKDTNAAVRNYQLYLANAQTNTVEAKAVLARLKELKPGVP